MSRADGPAWQRVLLKLSGESLAGASGVGLDPAAIAAAADQLADVVRVTGVGLAVVVGGGNHFRGVSAAAKSIDRVVADQMGMLGTVLNALPLADALRRRDVPVAVLSAVEVRGVVDGYDRARALEHLAAGRVLLLAAGLGAPFVSTDTGAALRALELDAQVVLMAKHGVDAVYDRDPNGPDGASAQPIAEVAHDEALRRGLRVMDVTALALCGEHDLPIHVFGADDPGALLRAVRGERFGTLVRAATGAPATQLQEVAP